MFPKKISHKYGDNEFSIVVDATDPDATLFHLSYTTAGVHRRKWCTIWSEYEFINSCGILNEPEELLATLAEKPVIEHSGDNVIATFHVAGRNKVYHVRIPMDSIGDKSDIEKIADLQTENSHLRERVAHLETQFEELSSNISVIAHHLLTGFYAGNTYLPHLEKYPAMLHDVDAYRKFDSVQHMHILTRKSCEPLFKKMVDAKLINVLIDMVFELTYIDLMMYPVAISNIKYLIKDLSPSQMKSSSDLTMLDMVNRNISNSAEFGIDQSGWREIKTCVEARMNVSH